MDEFNGPDVHAARRLADQQQVGVPLDLAGKHDLLLVPAREVLGGQFRVRRAHIKALHLAFRILADGGVVHQDAGAECRIVVIAEGHVLPSGKIHNQAFALPVFGDMGNAARTARLPVRQLARQVQRFAVHGDAARAIGIAAKNFQQLGLSLARNPRNAQYLSRPNLQINALQPLDAFIIAHAQALDVKHHVAGFGGGFVHPQQNLAAHHQLCQLGGRGLGCFESRGHLAAAHDADGIGDLHDLAQFMGDQDDGFALGAQAVEDAEQLVGFGRGQHTCRFVQDQDVSLPVERLENFHPLLHAHTDVLDQGIGLHIQAVVRGQLDQCPPCLGDGGFEPSSILGAQNNILQHREILDQFEVLEYHTDACCDGGLTVGDIGLFARNKYLTLISFVKAVEDRHQS